MNIHDGDQILTTKEEGVVEGSLLGSSVKYSALSSFTTYSSDSTADASSSCSNGPLNDLSDLISQLPVINVKRGLSRFYEGKSQSYTSLANVTCLKDLAKRGSRMKSGKSSQGLLNQGRTRPQKRQHSLKPFRFRVNLKTPS